MSDISDFKLGSISTGDATGMDAFFAREPEVVSPVGTVKAAAEKPVRLKVARTAQLAGFTRISEDMLVNKSTQDLWTIKKNGDDFYIERLFDDNGEPLKG